MFDDVSGWINGLSATPELQTLYAGVLLVFVAWLSNWVVKRILVRGLYRIASRYGDAPLQDFGIIKRLSNIVPALVISLGVAPSRGFRRPWSPSCAMSAAASSC